MRCRDGYNQRARSNGLVRVIARDPHAEDVCRGAKRAEGSFARDLIENVMDSGRGTLYNDQVVGVDKHNRLEGAVPPEDIGSPLALATLES
ncbi:hypothetical protein C362_02957 [Cryptococcus neoformans Bt1]|nr:hypothetical protein C362_02957 [Cryptococcus neoformans var. grubii Bt1]